jgi:hypothetical protein
VAEISIKKNSILLEDNLPSHPLTATVEFLAKKNFCRETFDDMAPFLARLKPELELVFSHKILVLPRQQAVF